MATGFPVGLGQLTDYGISFAAAVRLVVAPTQIGAVPL
jgi:hypothetical protein